MDDRKPEESEAVANEVAEVPVKAMFVTPTTTSSATEQATPHGAPAESAEALSETAAGPSKPPVKQQRQKQPKAPGQKKRKQRRTLPDAFSPAEVLFLDVKDFLGREYVDDLLASGSGKEWEAPEGLELWKEVELKVGAFTVSGE
jgi:tRNA (uracil-5-)-methyltransferase